MENKEKEDLAAPESWETADLEESVKRLLISPRKTPSPQLDSDPPPQPVQPPPQPSTEELINQVDQFLREALEKPRERISVLRMEQDIERFIRNANQLQIEFNSLPTSYLRLAAHRLAQHYYLQSIAIPDPVSPDGSGSRIIIRKISNETRLPAIRLAEIPINLPTDDSSLPPVKLAIKPRPHKGSHGNSGSGSNSRSNLLKSVEERKEEYNRARNRIFNNNNNNITSNPNNNNINNNSSSSTSRIIKPREEVKLPESLDNWIDTDIDEDPNPNPNPNPNSNSSNSNNNRNNKEGEGLTRTRSGNNSRVAIFRDREVDRKDPDYDRSYDRYAQRFDPGFGFNNINGPYPIQPLYAPAVTYHTEFPQLPPPQPLTQGRGVGGHMQCGPWAPGQQMAMAYRPLPPPEAMMAHAFNATSPMGAGGPGVRAPPVYLHSAQFAVQARPGMPVPFLSPHEHMHHQSFIQQQHQQQQEGSYGMARPR